MNLRKQLFFYALLMIAAWTFSSSEGSDPDPFGHQSGILPAYEVYAIQYGVIADFPVSALVAAADPSRKLDIAMMVWVLKRQDGRNVLVDTGFYREKSFKSWNIKNFIKPSEAITKVGLKPESITDIVLTHMHWDHAGSVDLFPNAHVWIQKEEFNYHKEKGDQAESTGVDPEDINVLTNLERKGKLTLVDGDARDAIPGVSLYKGGRHTYASQFVAARTESGIVVLASDNIYLYENLEKHVPIMQTLSAKENLEAQERMKKIASEERLIVPGHDPEVFKRFPSPGNGVSKIK